MPLGQTMPSETSEQPSAPAALPKRTNALKNRFVGTATNLRCRLDVVARPEADGDVRFEDALDARVPEHLASTTE